MVLLLTVQLLGLLLHAVAIAYPKPASPFNPLRPKLPTVCGPATMKLHASKTDDANVDSIFGTHRRRHADHASPHRHPDRRSAITRSLSSIVAATVPAHAAVAAVVPDEAVDGVPLITRSALGTTVRRTTVKSAQIADSLDERWERFSDSLRDRNRCDPSTNRRLFDNGFRRDGTRVGDPVLGALCDPVPLRPFDVGVAGLVLGSAEDQAVAMLGGAGKLDVLRAKEREVSDLVGLSFARAEKNVDGTADEREQGSRRRGYNKSVYVRMRAYREALLSGSESGGTSLAAEYELGWGRRILFDKTKPLISPMLANRKSFTSPFPALTEEDKGDLAYEEGALLDALGTVSAALAALQDGGMLGNWEISIPADDHGEVVTIAVDDDISLGAQTLLKEQRGFNGSVVTATVRAALDRERIACSVDAFFIDPSTTKQDVYEPTQLLLNLSNIRGK